ncbi:MAG: hypothetical protein RR645_06415, partial [Clostridium sp.]
MVSIKIKYKRRVKRIPIPKNKKKTNDTSNNNGSIKKADDFVISFLAINNYIINNDGRNFEGVSVIIISETKWGVGVFYVNRIRGYYRSKPKLYRNICYFFSGLFSLLYFGVITFLIGIIYTMYSFSFKSDYSIYTIFIFGTLSIVLIYFVLRVVILKKVKIRGMNLDRENYSKLWDIVDSLSTEFRSGRIKKIIITDNIKIRINTYNTHVFWGRKESVLEIGLPIVVGFSEKEIEHAIALIICKNSKTHTLKDKKIVYTYNKIEQILSKDGCILRSNSVINILILPIMEMLYDFYKKISFIVVRESKINADKLFITKYSADDLTNIILKQYIHTYIIQNVFLKRINKEIEDKGEIPGNIFTLMNEYLNEHISGRDITLALKIIKGSSREGLMFIGSPLNRIEAINSDIDNF